MTKLSLFCLCVSAVAGSVLAAGEAAGRDRISLNADWRFVRGDPEGAGDKLDYRSIKEWILPSGVTLTKNPLLNSLKRPEGNVGEDVAYTRPTFDDSSWSAVNLPHDWAIAGPFQQDLPGETGKLPWTGVGWYRKHFTLPKSDTGRRIYLDVDGAMSYAAVWCNGQIVGGWPYGYASWRLDLTPYVKPGEDNVLVIRLDNPEESSRWYPGAGIYRNVWLVKTGPVQIGHWGVQITTPEVTKNSAKVNVALNLENHLGTNTEFSVVTTLHELPVSSIRDPRVVASTIKGPVKIAANGTATHLTTLTVPTPRLWSIEQPNRYVAVTTLEHDGLVLDVAETPFGIRTIDFTAREGFFLNGELVELKGVCNHHDLGALGAAFNVRAAERQLEILKEMGGNAIRTSHNPPAPELLDLCDRMGFVVMDEAFDCWRGRKKRNDYHLLFPDWHEQDLRALARRDRNHPSVVLWSTGNEMPDMRSPEGAELSKQLTAIMHEEDPTRPVAAGCNHEEAGFNGFQKTLDVFGYNYKPQLYARFRQANPGIPLFASETASCISSRGEYFFPVSNDKSQGMADFQMSSYDLYAPRWAMPPDREFEGQDKNPFVAGEFVWTGFDYLGEPTPYNRDLSILNNYSNPEDRARAEKELAEVGKIRTPSRSSYFGIVDLAGFKKDRFYLYQSRWRPDLPMAHILPHWNWPEREGQITPVHVYTSGDEAELYLNNKSQGRKKKGEFEYRLRWDDVVYEPGELKVVAYKNGQRWAQEIVKTTGEAAKLVLEADRTRIAADGKDLSFIKVTVADKSGRLVPRSKPRIHFEIDGPGEIVATDNGDPTDHESFQSVDRNAFNGLALVIVRAMPGETGRIKVSAISDGLEVGDVTIRGR